MVSVLSGNFNNLLMQGVIMMQSGFIWEGTAVLSSPLFIFFFPIVNSAFNLMVRPKESIKI